MERTTKKPCKDAPHLHPLHRPQPELFEGINRAAKRALIDRLAHWNYLSTWEHGKRFVVKLRDLGEWGLVYQACSHMEPGRRPPNLDEVQEVLCYPGLSDLGWAFLSFVKVTGTQRSDVEVNRLVERTTDFQAPLFDLKSLKWIAASEAFRWVYKPFELPLGRQILLRTPQALPYFFFGAEDYTRIITSQQIAEKLSDEALLIAQSLDLGAEANQLINDELEWQGWDKETIRDQQRTSARKILAGKQYALVGSPLCPLPFAIELLVDAEDADQNRASTSYIQNIASSPLFTRWHAQIVDIFTSFEILSSRTRLDGGKLPSLSKDTWQYMTNFLSGQDLIGLAHTCKALYNLIFFERSDRIWRPICQQAFPNFTPAPEHCNDNTYHRMWLYTRQIQLLPPKNDNNE